MSKHGKLARRCGAAAVMITTGLVAAPAMAHLERPSYWPDPRPDTSVTPPAGGAVPTARSLASAVTGAGPGDVRVVCRKDSLTILRRSIATARKDGFSLRPSQPVRKLGRGQAGTLLKQNRSLYRRCRFKTIQAAVNASGNNDRVVIMPGRYTEQPSRAKPTNDPELQPVAAAGRPARDADAELRLPGDLPQRPEPRLHPGPRRQGQPLSPPAARPPRDSRAGARRVRALQPADRGLGRDPRGRADRRRHEVRQPARTPQDKPGGYAKHVVMRTDRTDGLVVRNLLLRGALEHGFYTEETDGVLLDKVKFFWAADYGHLSFTTDHNLIQNCDGFGAGDAVVYPGASPQTGDFRDTKVYPEKRFNTTVRRCDLHGSTLAYSGSMGNSVRDDREPHLRQHERHRQRHAVGPRAPRVPGRRHADRQQLHLLEQPQPLRLGNPPVKPLVPMPIGTGIVWPGMNGGEVFEQLDLRQLAPRHGAHRGARRARWRARGQRRLARSTARRRSLSSTSCGNRYHDNKMGQVPPGFSLADRDREVRQQARRARRPPCCRNGVDFWWDEFVGNNGNCWYDNIGPDGTKQSITGPGSGTPPDLLPGDCNNSVGILDVIKEAILLDCSMWSRSSPTKSHPLCYWFTMPPKPGTPAARSAERAFAQTIERYKLTIDHEFLRQRMQQLAADGTAFTTRHG